MLVACLTAAFGLLFAALSFGRAVGFSVWVPGWARTISTATVVIAIFELLLAGSLFRSARAHQEKNWFGPRLQFASATLLALLHPGRRRGAGLLPRQIRPRVQADRDQDDADRVQQHGNGAHRGLLAPARHHRHARERVQRLPPVQGDEGQARLPAAVRRRYGR